MIFDTLRFSSKSKPSSMEFFEIPIGLKQIQIICLQRVNTQRWQVEKEPHIIHIKSEDELRQKIGHMRNKSNASVPGALEKKEVGKKPKKRTWVVHQKKILEYLDTDDPETEEQESVETDDFPDLDKMASDFVDTYMNAMQEEDE